MVGKQKKAGWKADRKAEKKQAWRQNKSRVRKADWHKEAGKSMNAKTVRNSSQAGKNKEDDREAKGARQAG